MDDYDDKIISDIYKVLGATSQNSFAAQWECVQKLFNLVSFLDNLLFQLRETTRLMVDAKRVLYQVEKDSDRRKKKGIPPAVSLDELERLYSEMKQWNSHKFSAFNAADSCFRESKRHLTDLMTFKNYQSTGESLYKAQKALQNALNSCNKIVELNETREKTCIQLKQELELRKIEIDKLGISISP